MWSLTDQLIILYGIFGTPFFITSSFFILIGYTVLWFRKRQSLTNAISIFEVPLIVSCVAVLFSISHWGLHMLSRSIDVNPGEGPMFYVLTGIFFISTAMLTVANNLLLPLLFIYAISFYIKNTRFRLIMFIIAILYTNTKYLIFLRILPNFIQFNFTSFVSLHRCLAVNVIDLVMLLLTLIIIFVYLQLSTGPLTFEQSVVIFETVCLTILKIAGLIMDMISIGMFRKMHEHHFLITGVNTETMLRKNYEFTQMIIPYLFIICGFFIKLEEVRKKAAVSFTKTGDNGNVGCMKNGKTNNTSNSDGAPIRAAPVADPKV
ncbi:hypothetical protein L3Y34_006878 [Caenorhabditis briggsae]|uniref:Uncharacterized protein n=1 Tax=Caenorhabditis briggsae TaxID=6238 RepID=A0AAE9A5B6_CAEBR|nr:hypothetical protein L3Y34_006878 [Caenorhabditis briggsae]